MHNLFLDANVFLDFYRFGADDITEIGKLVALLRDGEVNLYTNSHLRNEVERMREGVLALSFAELRAVRYQVKPPNYSKSLKELDALNDVLRKANEMHSNLISALDTQIRNKNLPADALIREILDRGVDIQIDQGTLDRARYRRDLGNPPGKKNALGDALNWETLLHHSEIISLDLVSRDGDFESELDVGKIKDFLSQEWTGHKVEFADVTLFKSLSDYFLRRYPNIKISDEIRKIELIEQLKESQSYASTHQVIGDLSRFEYFTQSQISKLFEALCNNSQVGGIGTDTDVNEFFRRLRGGAWYVPLHLQDRAAQLLRLETSFFSPF